jgi:sugar phosphate isomerase/epimerase
LHEQAAAAVPLRDTARLALHTKTLQSLGLHECAVLCASAGIKGLSVWRDVLHDAGIDDGARMLADHGLAVPALVRGGFFVHRDGSARAQARDDNRRCLEEARALGAAMVVLVAGSAPGDGVTLDAGRDQVRAALEDLLPYADAAGVTLALEPMHPMYAADKSCINTLRDANDLCDAIAHPRLGLAVDVYHVWWDKDLPAQIARAGAKGRLRGFHLCDWRVQTRDLLLDRELMGRGCIPLRAIRGCMESAGFAGWHEVEIFSRAYWALDPTQFLADIKAAYLAHC